MITHDQVIHMLSTSSTEDDAERDAAAEPERYRRDAARALIDGWVPPELRPLPLPSESEEHIRSALHIDEDIVFYAFRYCLGRRTYAVSDCARYLHQHWHALRPRTQHLIHREIHEALERNAAGDVIDVRMWQDVLRLPLVGVLIAPLPTIGRDQAVIGVDAMLALIDEVEARYPPDVFPEQGTTPDALAGTMARLVCAQLRDLLHDRVDAVVEGGDV